MSISYPIPREIRRVDYVATAGQTVFGPSGFKAFDTLDVAVYRKPVGDDDFTRIDGSGVVIALSGAAPASPTVTISPAAAADEIIRVQGERLHERQFDVTRAGVIVSAPLEDEFDKQTVILQELRRDVDGLFILVNELRDELDALQELIESLDLAGVNDRLTAAEADIDDLQARMIIVEGGGGGGAGSGMFIGDDPPPAPAHGDEWWNSATGNLFIYYDDGSSAQWVQTNGGGGGGLTEAPADGALYGRASAGWIKGVKLSGDAMTGVLRFDSNNVADSGIIHYRTNPAIFGELCNIAEGPSYMLNATGQRLALAIAGTAKLSVYESGQVALSGASAANNFDAGTSQPTFHGVLSTGSNEGAALFGFATGGTMFGAVGAYLSGTAYSFYGNTGAFLSAGTWATSDGTLKDVTGAVDPAKALAAVNSLPVREYTPKSAQAGRTLYGEDAPETLYGWIAQDVEKILPIAVRDVGVPGDDFATRAMLRDCAAPAKAENPADRTPEEKSFREAPVSIKAINDRYMLTTLWAAVQQLSAQNEKLLVELDRLKAGA
jgi:hypothetical protein